MDSRIPSHMPSTWNTRHPLPYLLWWTAHILHKAWHKFHLHVSSSYQTPHTLILHIFLSVLLPITAAEQSPGVTTISVSFSYHSSIKPNAGADTDGHHRPHVLPYREGEVSLSAHRNPVGRCRAPPDHSAHAGSSNSMPMTSGCARHASIRSHTAGDLCLHSKRSV